MLVCLDVILWVNGLRNYVDIWFIVLCFTFEGTWYIVGKGNPPNPWTLLPHKESTVLLFSPSEYTSRRRCEKPWLALVFILFWFDILPLVDKDFTCTSDYSDIFVLQGTGDPVTIFAFDIKSSSESQVSTEKVGTLVCNVWTCCVGMSVISILQWIHLEKIYS